MSAAAITSQELQERFLGGLARRLDLLCQCLAALREPSDAAGPPAALDDMMRGFHSLAGIGGTYGFGRITDVARIGELACAALDGPIAAHDVARLSEILHSLVLAASEAVSGTSTGSWVLNSEH